MRSLRALLQICHRAGTSLAHVCYIVTVIMRYDVHIMSWQSLWKARDFTPEGMAGV